MQEVDVETSVGDRHVGGLDQGGSRANLGEGVNVLEDPHTLDVDVEDAGAHRHCAGVVLGEVQPHLIGAVRHREAVTKLR